MGEKLRRPDDYVPLGVRVAFSKTGTTLLERLGNDGLLTWILFLAACGRDRPFGELTYTSDVDFWISLGLPAHRPAFSPDEFFKLTGQLKQTRRTRSGRTTYVLATHWQEWNNEHRRQTKREQLRWNRRKKQGDTLEHNGDSHDTVLEQGGDTEPEPEEEKSFSTRPEAQLATPPPALVENDLEDIGQAIAARLNGPAPRGSVESIIEVCDEVDENTPAVLRDLCEKLSVNLVAQARQEAVDSPSVRGRTRYVVGILQRMVRERSAA